MAAKEVTGQNFSLITRLPDDDTKEVTLYGSAYTVVKAALFNLDRMEHIIAMRAAANVENILSRKQEVNEYIDVIIAAPYKDIPRNSPGYETKTMIKKHMEYRGGIMWCKNKRSMVKMYGRLIGAQEMGVKLKESPEQLKIWRDSVLQLANEPLEYSSIEEHYV